MADLFRLAWGLLYWNARKTAFRLRKGRNPCPCQSPSDSGRALETACEASLSWARQERFRRVCPLLVRTSAGLRCSADTADVRPFWLRALGIYGGSLLGLYGTLVLAVFVFLRVIGYPVSPVHVAWPGLWYRVPQVRGDFFLGRANRAFAEGRVGEGLLYLQNAYEFDPGNYSVALEMAHTYQAVQPAISNQVFERMLIDHPEHRDEIAGMWLGALLPRADYRQICKLAIAEIHWDHAHVNAWMRALVFACRRLGDSAPLEQLAADGSAAALPWHALASTEILFEAGHSDLARAALERTWPSPQPEYTVYYQIRLRTELGDSWSAAQELAEHARDLGPEWRVALALETLTAAGAVREMQREVDGLLSGPLNPSAITLLCAQLVRRPDPALFNRVWSKVQEAGLKVDGATAPVWFSLLCAAGSGGDRDHLHAIVSMISAQPGSPRMSAAAAERFFRGESIQTRISSLLPWMSLPLEIDYAMLERYQPRRPRPMAP